MIGALGSGLGWAASWACAVDAKASAPAAIPVSNTHLFKAISPPVSQAKRTFHEKVPWVDNLAQIQGAYRSAVRCESVPGCGMTAAAPSPMIAKPDQ